MPEDLLATTAITAFKAAVTGVTGAFGAQWYKQRRSETNEDQQG